MINLLKKLKRNIYNTYYFFKGFFYPDKYFDIYEQGFLLIPGCRDRSLREQYKKGNLVYLKNPLNEYYKQLINIVIDKVKTKTPYTIVRVSDGEANFLQGKLIGNGPKRHFTKANSLKDVDMESFKKGLLKCSSCHIEMYKSNQRDFNKIYGKNVFSDIPFECIYALISTRYLTRNKFRIGIIGADNKISIIKKLITFEKYREYIGRNSFEDYISIPEKGSSNNPNELVEYIQSKLKDDIDIYLVGIGIAKLAIMHKFAEKNNSVFIDVGAGISALSGLVSYDRPYFADWVNFRLKDFDYSKMDIMDADMQDKKIVNL